MEEVVLRPAPTPPAPRRGVRSGSLIDTGDAMPNTNFQRPNPLDSDVVMDATARLLAPRRPLLSGLLPKPAEKKKQPEQSKPKPQKAEEPQKAKRPRPKKSAKAEDAPTPQQRKKRAGKPQRRGRPMPPDPPRKNQPKDSTEQASLMKPYYLDIDR